MESSAKTRLPLHSIELFILRRRSTHALQFGIIFTHILFTIGGESSSKELIFHSQVSVFGNSCQRGRKYQPKAKGPHHHHHLIFKNQRFSIGFFWYLIFDKILNQYTLFKINIKTLLNTKRRISLRGSFVQSKEKHLKQGEKFSNLENASQNPIHIPLTIYKRF